MTDKEDKIQQFKTVTGIDEERARFFLESSRWDLEIAIASFYENDDPEPVVNEPDAPEPQQSPEETSPTPQQPQPTIKNKPTRNSRPATIHTLNSSSEEEEEGQAFYAGGSEHSGQQVLGPSKKKDFVSDMFKAVKEHGVELAEPSAGSSNAHVFRGTGYKLGQTETDSEVVPGANAPKPPEQITLKLWADGFSLDDGELRHYTDPSNREFLESIRRGEIPPELRRDTAEVHLAMEDHRMETFKKDLQATRRKPFTGHGYTLGSPAPAAVGAPAVAEKDCAANEANAKKLIAVDTSKPTTNLQIRLSDGTRLVAQFNHNHTIADVRSYIVVARPQYQTRSFALLSTYPSRELSDSDTLLSAGLLNSAIMQKLT